MQKCNTRKYSLQEIFEKYKKCGILSPCEKIVCILTKGEPIYMEYKKELTKNLLTASFKELVLQVPFEKITIKMITDGAGVIRPTFYKHFQDKYEVLEWILQTEIKSKIQVLIDNNMQEDIFRLLCNCLEKDRAFYRKAYEIKGQNSFEDIMSDYLYTLFLQLLSKYPLKSPDKLAFLTKEAIARFYTFGLADSLKYWISQDALIPAKDINAAYSYIIRNSILDILDYPQKK